MNYRTLCVPLFFSISLLVHGCGGGSSSNSTGDAGNGTAADTSSDGSTGDSGSASGGGDADGGEGGVTGSAAIAGLWDVTEDGDIQYQEFTADGFATNWDYDADEWGDGQNCYFRFGPIAFDHLGEDRFDGFGELVTVSVQGNEITISDSEGTFTYPRVEGLSSSDFPLCE